MLWGHGCHHGPLGYPTINVRLSHELVWGQLIMNFAAPEVRQEGSAARFPYPKFPGLIWADLREDKMIDPAPGFWPIFGPLGPTAGPESPGNGPGSTKNAGCAKIQPRRPIISRIIGHFVFLKPTDKK